MTSTSRLLGLALLVAGATPAALAQQPAAPAPTPTEVRLAICVLQPTQGNTCRGVVRFQQVEGGVRITVEITGLPPSTKHGFHVHERGDISAPDGSSCGGHYNPEGHGHAGPQHAKRHAGDLGNVDADAQGVAKYEVTLANLTLAGPRNAIIGRSLVLHAQADDLSSQPAGNAGARIAVGVIGVAADTTPPTVTVLSPREGSRVNRNPVNVVVQAQDDQGVAGVTINGAAATPDGSGPGRWNCLLYTSPSPRD